MNLPHPHSGKSGFTMVELLVAMAIGIIVVTLALSLTTHAMGRLSLSSDRLELESTARFALNRISEDLESLVQLPLPSQWLVLRTDVVGPPNFTAIDAARLMFYSSVGDRPGRNSGDGEVSAVRYGLSFQGLQSHDAHPFFGLYRAVIPASSTFSNAVGTGNLESLWEADGVFSSFASSRAGLLAKNVIGLRIAFNFRRADGSMESVEAPISLGKTWIAEAWETEGPASELASVEIHLTLLTKRGAKLLQDGALPREELVRRYGFSYSRRVPIHSKPLRSIR